MAAFRIGCLMFLGTLLVYLMVIVTVIPIFGVRMHFDLVDIFTTLFALSANIMVLAHSLRRHP